MKPLYMASILLFLLAASSVVAYQMIGAYVDENGFLHEPFVLIPLAYIFGISGVITALCGAFCK